jgi:putative transposase
MRRSKSTGQRSREGIGRRELAAEALGGRQAVQMHILEEVSTKVAAACGGGALELSRSSYYRSRSSLESRRIRKEVLELSAKHPPYGYRRISALRRREG